MLSGEDRRDACIPFDPTMLKPEADAGPLVVGLSPAVTTGVAVAGLEVTSERRSVPAVAGAPIAPAGASASDGREPDSVKDGERRIRPGTVDAGLTKDRRRMTGKALCTLRGDKTGALLGPESVPGPRGGGWWTVAGLPGGPIAVVRGAAPSKGMRAAPSPGDDVMTRAGFRRTPCGRADAGRLVVGVVVVAMAGVAVAGVAVWGLELMSEDRGLANEAGAPGGPVTASAPGGREPDGVKGDECPSRPGTVDAGLTKGRRRITGKAFWTLEGDKAGVCPGPEGRRGPRGTR